MCKKYKRVKSTFCYDCYIMMGPLNVASPVIRYVLFHFQRNLYLLKFNGMYYQV
jgi:hypothetical protein